MELSLLQTAPADPRAFLELLRGHLPKRVYARARVLHSLPAEADDLPRFVVHLTEATEEDEAAVTEALAAVPNPAFELRTTGPELVMSAPPTADEAPSAPATLARWIAPLPQLTARQAAVGEILDDILKAKPSGIDFPEFSYTGDHREAYASICEQLGAKPIEDKGRTIHLADFAKVKKPKRPRIPDSVWSEVLEHLRREIRFYGYAADWFGDGGHLRNSYRDLVFFDLDFVERTNTDFGLIKNTAKSVSFEMQLAMDLALRLIGSIPEVGPLITLILKISWDATKAAMGGGSGALTSAIREMRKKVVQAFETSIQVVETCHGGLLTDWGNLDKFGQLILGDELVWPVNSQPIRDGHRYAFQYEAMRCLVELKHRTETRVSNDDKYLWCVLQISVKHDKPVSRGFDWKNRRLNLKASTKDCGSYPGKAIIIGRQECHRAVTYNYQWYCQSPKNSSKAFYRKLFGNSKEDVNNIELAIPLTFLENFSEREGWGI